MVNLAILWATLVPFVRQHFGDNFRFQDENAMPHRSRAVICSKKTSLKRTSLHNPLTATPSSIWGTNCGVLSTTWIISHITSINSVRLCWIRAPTVYPKKYAHGFCFAVLCCGYTWTDFPISIRLTSLALWQSNDCPSASKATLMNMDKYFMWIHYERLHNHNKAKHNKTVCIFLGIYCISPWNVCNVWWPACPGD